MWSRGPFWLTSGHALQFCTLLYFYIIYVKIKYKIVTFYLFFWSMTPLILSFYFFDCLLMCISTKIYLCITLWCWLMGFRWEVIGDNDGIQYGPFPVPKGGLPITLHPRNKKWSHWIITLVLIKSNQSKCLWGQIIIWPHFNPNVC